MKITTSRSEFERRVKNKLAKWSDLDIELVEDESVNGFSFHLEEKALSQVEAFFEAHIRPSTQLLGKKDNGRKVIVTQSEIYFIEAIGREVFAYTKEEGFQLKQKLYELEPLEGFIRINKSTIVNVLQVTSLLSLLNGKLLLTLKDDQELEVSRSYVKDFKTYLKEGVMG